MDIAFVIDRVRTQVIALRQVGGAADMDAALEAAPAVPCAFVIPLGERGQLIGSTQITRQSLHRAIGVVIGIANRRDAKGQASMQDLAPLRQALKVARQVADVHPLRPGRPGSCPRTSFQSHSRSLAAENSYRRPELAACVG